MTEKDAFTKVSHAEENSGLTFADAIGESKISNPTSAADLSWSGAGTWTGIGGSLGAGSLAAISRIIGAPAVGFGDDYYQAASLMDRVLGRTFAESGAGLAVKGGVYGLAFGAAAGGMFYLAYKTDQKKSSDSTNA